MFKPTVWLEGKYSSAPVLHIGCKSYAIDVEAVNANDIILDGVLRHEHAIRNLNDAYSNMEAAAGRVAEATAGGARYDTQWLTHYSEQILAASREVEESERFVVAVARATGATKPL
jgi:hypothetical protein